MPTAIQNQQQLVREAVPVRLAPPPMYQVVLLNDDYTPMDFVVRVLQQVFHKGGAEAERIMLQVHHEGRGYAASTRATWPPPGSMPCCTWPMPISTPCNA